MNPWILFRQSLTLLKANWKYLLKYYLITSLVFLIPVVTGAIMASFLYPLYQLQQTPVMNYPLFGLIAVLSIVFFVLMAWLVPASLLMMRSLVDGQKLAMKDIFGSAKKFILPMLGTGLLAGLIIMGGLILLIVPGIIFSIWFSFVQYLVIEENISGTKALRRSRELVKGRFWQVAWYTAFIAILGMGVGFVSDLASATKIQVISITVAILVSIVSFVINLATPIYAYLVYRHFKQSSA